MSLDSRAICKNLKGSGEVVTFRHHILLCIMCTFFAQIFEGKIKMHIIDRYNNYIPWV